MTSEIIEKPMSAECTMKQYEAIPDADFVENREYQLTDYPDNGANAEQMAYALTCKRLFPAGTVVTFSGTTDSNYTNGHLYQIQVDDSGAKSWKDITPTGNALTKPTTAPSATQIVAVDNTNTQTMLNIGDGLSVENGSLKASGGSDNFYRHTLRIDYTTSTEKLLIVFSIITRTSEIFTYETLKSYLTNKNTAVNGFKWQNNYNNRIYFISDIFADENGLQYNSSYVSLNENKFTFDFDETKVIPTAVDVYDYVYVVT